ncbi:MAG: DUF2807 domain-containing protein [Pedobacter sp.]|nr:DUF2807 domain-containing protein [Pedobacter sp.]
MRKFSLNSIVYLSLGLLLLSSCNGFDCINGSGNQVTESRDIGTFNQVETSGSLKIVLSQDSTSSVRILADDNIQKEIQTRLSGNTLKIDIEGNFCDAGPVTIYLGSKDYQKIESSGSVEVLSEGKLNLNELDLELHGSSKVMLDLNVKSLRTSSSGSSEIVLKGQAGIHDLDMTGSSSVEALDFVVGEYQINSTGASKSRINVLNSLEVNSRGASEVEYKGKPSKIEKDNSGASVVRSIN